MIRTVIPFMKFRIRVNMIIENLIKGLLFCICIGTQLTYAGTYGSGNGQVQSLAAGGLGTGHATSNLVWFQVENYTMGDCARDNSPYFVIDTTESGGTSMLSMLLAAKMSGREIFIAGEGKCDLYPGNEDVSYIYYK